MASKSSFMPMLILGVLFFVFGFVTWLNGSLIPFLQHLCELDAFEALFVTFAFYIAYTVMAFPMAFVLEKTGYKNAMALGLGVMAFGALIFIPAAFTREFLLFLVALFTLGTGLTILQTASNPYIVFLGPKESAARRISIMGILNKAAGVVAPLVFTLLVVMEPQSGLAFDLQKKEELANALIFPYMLMAGLLLLLMLLVIFSKLPELEFSKDSEEGKSIFAFPQLILGAVALFFYVGAEVIAGDTIGLYGQSLGVLNATVLTSYTMAFMVLGYIVGLFFIPKYLSQERALLLSAFFGIVLVFAIVFGSQTQSDIWLFILGWSTFVPLPNTLFFVALLGFANALVWPTIWPLALDGLQKYTAKGSALLIMAIAGGAILPLVFGKITQITQNMQLSYLFLLISYLFILLYALKWHKKRSW